MIHGFRGELRVASQAIAVPVKSKQLLSGELQIPRRPTGWSPVNPRFRSDQPIALQRILGRLESNALTTSECSMSPRATKSSRRPCPRLPCVSTVVSRQRRIGEGDDRRAVR